MDDYDAVFCANMLLEERLTLEIKRGYFHQYLEGVGIHDVQDESKMKGVLELLIHCLGTKTQHAAVARTIDEILTQRYTQ